MQLSQRGDQRCSLQPPRAQGGEQQSPEEHLLQKACQKHGQNVDECVKRRKIPLHPVPQVAAGRHRQGEKPEILSRCAAEAAQSEKFCQALTPDPAAQYETEHNARGDGEQIRRAQPGGDAFRCTECAYINADARQRKEKRIFLIELCHAFSFSVVR